MSSSSNQKQERQTFTVRLEASVAAREAREKAARASFTPENISDHGERRRRQSEEGNATTQQSFFDRWPKKTTA